MLQTLQTLPPFLLYLTGVKTEYAPPYNMTQICAVFIQAKYDHIKSRIVDRLHV
jgi:hypothetical protein